VAQILDMPRLSDTMKEGVLRKWHKKEGDALAPGDVIAEVETDKATMDFESFDEGVLLKRLIGDGDAVPVGAPVAIIGAAGEDIEGILEQAKGRAGGVGSSGGAKAAATKPAATKPAAVPATPPKPEAAPTAPPQAASAAPAPPPARVTRTPVAASAPAPVAGSGKTLASPLARRLAADLGIDLRGLRGSGPGGRIVERDVKAASGGGDAPAEGAAPAEESESPDESAPRARSSAASASPPPPAALVPDRRSEPRPSSAAPPQTDDVRKPLSLMRKTIARRMLEAKTTIPHFYLEAEVDMDAAMAFRDQVSEVHGAKLSVNDLCIKAAALALRRVPAANASLEDDAIVQHARVDVGMAVAIDDGLLTPVIRGADGKTLGQIAAEAHDFAARARDRKLRPEDMTGSTFTVSNLGMFGITAFSAIINPPEAAILAVGNVRKVPIVKDRAITIGQRMFLTLSCDHRVVDGAIGAKLLSAIVAILERPMTLAF